MFSVSNKKENGFDIVVLNDQSLGTSVEIIPECGAIMHAFNILHENKNLNIIDQYKNKKEFEDRVEVEGFKSCKLSPFVCRLKAGRYKFGENDYTIEKFYMDKHALHGLIYDAAFTIVQLDADTEKARLELMFSYNGKDKGFPFKYDCRVIYELTKNNTLEIITSIKNNESNAIPIADGWHPYFTFGDKVNKLQLQFNCNEMLEFDEDLLPNGKKLPTTLFNELTTIGTTTLDNSFIVNTEKPKPTATLRDPLKNLQIEISADKSYPILQVYIPESRNSIAIENLSAAPDAFNNHIGLTVLAAGKETEFSTTYKIVQL